MPPYTKLLRPAGRLKFSYSPLSPMNWGIVTTAFDIFVYPDVQTALQALLQTATTLQAQRLEKGTAALFTDHIYFRGHTNASHRLLPTRLRGEHHEPQARRRFSMRDQSDEVRQYLGDWFEQDERMRRVGTLLNELPEEELRARSKSEATYVKRAAGIPSFERLTDFQKRAAVRHYSLAPSPLLDISTDLEVAAFFATGGGLKKPPSPGTIGMLWAIDLNFLAGLFSFAITSIPDGKKIRLAEMCEHWGDNKELFEDQEILSTNLEMTSVALPFRRPTAQSARFFALTGEDGAELPPRTELTWWSIIERRAYPCAFIQDGNVYKNTEHNIAAEVLLPADEDLAHALA